MSTTKPVRPLCLGRSGSVRQMISPMSVYWAPDVHTFWPVMTHSSPSRSALVCRLARSEPAPGSLNSWQPTMSPRYIAVQVARPWPSSVAWARIVGATMPRPMPKKPWLGTSYSALERRRRPARRRCGSSRPPYSAGPVIQPKPASKRLARHSLASASSASSLVAVALLEHRDVVGALAPDELLLVLPSRRRWRRGRR